MTLISERRLEHSISVANLSYQIAASNNLEHPIKAYIAGLVHDIGKEIPHDDARKIMEEDFKEYQDLPRFAYHQFVAVRIIRDIFKIEDQDIIEAIKYHATGNKDLTPLGKIIYSADKIEPTRGFDSSDLINACLKDYDQGFKEVLRANKEYLLSKGKDINNPLTDKCFEEYL